MDEREIIIEPTHKIKGFQLIVKWLYKCKNGRKWLDAYGFSSKLNDDNYPTKLELELMLDEADNNAWRQYVCSPQSEYRAKIYLKKFQPQEPSNINKGVKEVRTKSEREVEYYKLKDKLDFNLDYEKLLDKNYKAAKESNAKLTKKDFRKKYNKEFINKKEYEMLRKLIKHQRLEEKEKVYAKKVRIRNNKIISLYKTYGSK
jgi:hypothetical protein